MRKAFASVALALAMQVGAAWAADGSFADWRTTKGTWVRKGDVFGQMTVDADCRAFAPVADWTDYTYEVKARKLGGAEGFLILFRVRDTDRFYWWNIGGWGNSRHALETRGGSGRFPSVNGRVETGKWYDIKIVVEGTSIECFLDGRQVHKVSNSSFKSGGIALGSWRTEVQYKNIRVTSPDGKLLYRTKPTDASPSRIEMFRRELSPEEKAARRATLAKVSRVCPRLAFITRRGYGMHGTNATMFARRTGVGAEIRVLDTTKPDEDAKAIFETREGFILDMNPSYDGKKLVFAYKERNDRPFHIWEIGVDGSGLRQITKGPFHDVSPVYYPDGRIVFTSSRVESFSLCQDFLASALFICNGDGSNLRRIDFTTLCSCSPSILSDGRILFTRWEYQDKNIFSWEGLWTLLPNGRQLKLYHGNTLTIPNAVYGAEEIPGTRTAILTMAAHHHVPIGDIAIVDRSKGVEATGGMRQITFATPYRVTKGRNWRDTNWGPGDRFHGRSFVDPFPVSKAYSLVGDGRKGWFTIALLSHADGKTVPVYTDRECFSPVPLQPRPLPHAVPGECPREPGFGTFLVQDVYRGLLRQGVKRGQVKELRIMCQIPKKYNTEGPRYHDHYPIVGQGTYYVKSIYGTVPVDADGAAYFRAPSNVEIYFQALDEHGKEIIRMGSVTQITTGEHASCVGCHEARLDTPAVNSDQVARMNRPPDAIKPPSWGAGTVDYVRQVQPVLDRYCVKCHDGPNPDKGINLTGDKTRFYSMSYESLVFNRYVDYFYINQGPTGNFPALETGSWVSKLTKLLESKHGEVDVDPASRRRIYAWIDANVPYYGTWEMSRPHSQGGRDASTIPNGGRPKPAPWVKELQEICKQKQVKIDWRSINYTHPEHTLALVQLLAKKAGGAAPAAEARFKSKDDPDYRAVIAVLNKARDTLLAHPRMDMAGGKQIPQSRDFGRVY